MVYFSLFWVSFLGGSILPISSEFTLVGLLSTNNYNELGLLIIASLGNILGAVCNWILGFYSLKYINKKWFKRGYDQALMLPILSLTKNRTYVNEVCYLYNIESVSVDDRDWAEMEQLSTINLVRARGFLS